jgi:hypothetical protein
VHALWTIRLPTVADFFSSAGRSKKHSWEAARRTASRAFLNSHRDIKSAAEIILNCTKNTELTREPFARTFSFALTQNVQLSSGPKRQQEAAASSRHRANSATGFRTMKSMEWKTYRTRFLVKARKLNYSLTFTDPLGRQHCGRKGDYLVESSDGVISIAPRQIFEDVYVPMSAPVEAAADQRVKELGLAPVRARATNSKQIRCEPLRAEEIVSTKILPPVADRFQRNPEEGRPRRKSPQPVRSLRLLSHLGFIGTKEQQL